jgi:hypothetical protein
MGSGRPPAHAHLELAKALIYQRRFAEGEAELVAGLSERSSDAPIEPAFLELLGCLCLERNDPARDEETAAWLLQRHPDAPEVSAFLTKLRIHRDRGADAETAEAWANEPELPPDRVTAPAGGGCSRPWRSVLLPSSVTSVRSMSSFEDQKYLTWSTAEIYQARGAIVELGCWLGASTVALAEGLRRRGMNAVIHSIDRFTWEPYMEAASHAGLQSGDDFMPLFVEETREYSQWIVPQKQELLDSTWNGGPIEFLFLDSAKSWEAVNAVMKVFGPHLIPGVSRVIVQDFRYAWAHCLPLTFDSRSDLWKEAETMDDSDMAVFIPLKALTGPVGVHTDYAEEAFPFEAAKQIFESRMSRESPQNRTRLIQGLYRKCLIDGPGEEVAKRRAEVLAGGAGPGDLAMIEDVEPILVPRGWKAYESGDFDAARSIADRCLSIPGKRSLYALTLRGFALLRLGDRAQAEAIMNEVLSVSPGFASAKLFRSELALGSGRYVEAEQEALDVLISPPGDETTVQWALNLLTQAWTGLGDRPEHAAMIRRLAEKLSGSTSFNAWCAARSLVTHANRQSPRD